MDTRQLRGHLTESAFERVRETLMVVMYGDHTLLTNCRGTGALHQHWKRKRLVLGPLSSSPNDCIRAVNYVALTPTEECRWSVPQRPSHKQKPLHGITTRALHELPSCRSKFLAEYVQPPAISLQVLEADLFCRWQVYEQDTVSVRTERSKQRTLRCQKNKKRCDLLWSSSLMQNEI
jgi:hypothetical protein